MGLLERAGFKKKKPILSREQALGAKPIRNTLVQWERGEDGEIQIQIPRRTDRKARFLARLFPAPPVKVIVLDEVGSEIWDMCDGQTSVSELVQAIRKKYKLNRKETEMSVTLYLKQLAQRGLIGFRIEGGQP